MMIQCQYQRHRSLFSRPNNEYIDIYIYITFLPSSMRTGSSHRVRQSSFLDEKTLDRGIKEEYSGGRNFSHTVSDLTADSKLLETEAATHASRGLVKEIILEMQSSGKKSNGDGPVVMISPLDSTPCFCPIVACIIVLEDRGGKGMERPGLYYVLIQRLVTVSKVTSVVMEFKMTSCKVARKYLQNCPLLRQYVPRASPSSRCIVFTWIYKKKPIYSWQSIFFFIILGVFLNFEYR